MSDPDLTPAQDESVRALLAGARHSEPTPPDVVSRLDETLKDLVAQRHEERAPVVTLASRRRRRASAGLLAAAAAVVLGVGVTQVLPSMSGGGSDSATSGGAAEGTASQSDRSFGAEAPAAGGDGAGQDTGSDQAEPEAAEEKSPLGSTALDARPTLVSTSPLKRQLRDAELARRTAPFSASPTCPVPVAGSADQVPVTYDGAPGVLIYRPPVAGRQQVDLFLCGETDSFVSVKVKAR